MRILARSKLAVAAGAAAGAVLASCAPLELAEFRVEDDAPDSSADGSAADAGAEVDDGTPDDAGDLGNDGSDAVDGAGDDAVSDSDGEPDDTDAADSFGADSDADAPDACVDNGCGGCTPLPALGAPCGPCGVDENVCDGSDAVRCGGATACTEDPPPPPATVTASDGDFDDMVRLTWSSAARAAAYRVYRDGAFVAELSERTYDDLAAPAPPPPPAVTDLAGADGTTGITLTWTPVVAGDGAAASYTVRSWSPGGGESDDSIVDAGYRRALPIVGYDVRVGEGEWMAIESSDGATREAAFGAGVAPRPAVSAGTASASRGAGGIDLAASGFGVATESASWRVRARTATQIAEPSNPAAATWQGGPLAYTWLRSTSPAGPFAEPQFNAASAVDTSTLRSATRYFYTLTVQAGAATPWVLSSPVSAVAPHCGDATVDPGEDCDGALADGVTCASLGFTSGTPACAGDCAVSTAGCVRLAEVTTSAIITGAIANTTARLDGNLTSLGVPSPTQHGFCRGPSTNPAEGGAGVVCSRLGAAAATGPFFENATGLEASTTYHVRAYATNAAGTAYGTSRSFTTRAYFCGDGLITGIEECDGGVGGFDCEAFGFVAGDLSCGSDCNFDTTDCLDALCGDDRVTGSEACDGSVPAGVTCVSLGFTSGTPACGAGCEIDTSGCRRLPTVTTSVVTTATVTSSAAVFDGNVTSLGAPNPTQHGFCRGTSANPAIGGSGVVCSTLGARTSTGAFNEAVSGLNPSTAYHVRAYATNAAGTAYGASQTFTTTGAVQLLGTECTSDGQCLSGLCSTDATDAANRRCVPRELPAAAGGAMQFRYVPPTGPGGYVQGSGGSPTFTAVISRGMFVARTELTQGQWNAATGGTNPSYFQNTTCRFSSCASNENANMGGPVEQVDWWSAAAYANWLSDQAGLARCYTFAPTNWDRDVVNWADGVGATPDEGSGEGSGGGGGVGVTGITWGGRSCEGYRLPTESEWEWATRGPVSLGTLTTNFFFGATVDSAYLWYSSNANSRTQSASANRANAYGLRNTSGNVWEWVWDWDGTYPSGTQNDPVGPTTGTFRIQRGGSWFNDSSFAMSRIRRSSAPGARDSGRGFRLVRTFL